MYLSSRLIYTVKVSSLVYLTTMIRHKEAGQRKKIKRTIVESALIHNRHLCEPVLDFGYIDVANLLFVEHPNVREF